MYIGVIFVGAEGWPHRPIDDEEIPKTDVWIGSRKC